MAVKFASAATLPFTSAWALIVRHSPKRGFACAEAASWMNDLWSSGRLMVPKAAAAFDESGTLVDDKIRERLRRSLDGFVAHLR